MKLEENHLIQSKAFGSRKKKNGHEIFIPNRVCPCSLVVVKIIEQREKGREIQDLGLGTSLSL